MTKSQIFFVVVFWGIFLLVAVVSIMGDDHDQKLNQISQNYINQTTQLRWYASSKDSSLSDMAIQSELSNCMKGLNLKIHPIRSSIDRLFSPSIDKAQTTNAINANEEACTKDMIQTVALGNASGASALSSYLMQKGIAIPNEYKKFAKADDVALASVHF